MMTTLTISDRAEDLLQRLKPMFNLDPPSNGQVEVMLASYHLPGRFIWRFIIEALFAAGLTEEQVIERLKSKDCRWILEGSGQYADLIVPLMAQFGEIIARQLIIVGKAHGDLPQ